MSNWRNFKKLTGSERWVLIQALFLLPVTDIALRVLGFRRWHWVLTLLSGGGSRLAVGNMDERAHACARMVSVAARRGLYHTSCLRQSLVLWFLLHRQGIESQIRIGVRKPADKFEAHAWVEFLGQALDDRIHEEYSPFDTPISSTAHIVV